MNIDLTQSEMNELIYALGIAKLEGRMIRKDIADQVEGKLYRALAVENVHLNELKLSKFGYGQIANKQWEEYVKMKCEEDEISHDMNFKTRYIQSGDY